VLAGIGRLDVELGARTHPLLGRGSVHASLIEGGSELSTYPARCAVSIERRTLPGDTQATVESEVEAILDRCRAEDGDFVAEQRTLLVREPFEVPGDAEIVRAVRETAADALSAPPAMAGAPYWADAAFIAAAGIPTVMFGPGGAGAHAVEEWVSIADTERATRVLVDVASRLCA
jgi:acetylornithine deacetylase